MTLERILFALLCGGGVVGLFLLLRTVLRVRADSEIDVVGDAGFSVGAKMGRSCLDEALFVRASLCNPEVAAAFARAGWSEVQVTRELEALLGSPTPPPPDGSRLSPEISRALVAAGRATALRWNRVVTLADVLIAIRDRIETPTSQLLRARAIRFDDPILVSVMPNDPDATAPEHFVYILNDSVSQMEPVTKLLETAMGFDAFRAAYMMLAIHRRGYGALGPYDAAAAEEIFQRLKLAAGSLGMDKLAFARQAPNTTGWKKTDKGLLPLGKNDLRNA
jgi:ATP-dependent Clp protease adapter protein ClpS